MKADECWSALKNKCVLCNEPETSTSTDIIWRLKLRYCTGCMISNTMTKRDVDKGFGGNNSQLLHFQNMPGRILEVQPKQKKKAKACVRADLQQVLQQQHGVNSFDQ
jgi:hypothetical protein